MTYPYSESQNSWYSVRVFFLLVGLSNQKNNSTQWSLKSNPETLVNSSAAFPAALCSTWQGQPAIIISLFFSFTGLAIELCRPMLELILSTPMLVTYSQCKSNSENRSSTLFNMVAAVDPSFPPVTFIPRNFVMTQIKIDIE